jgi:hypothetical protein
MSSDLQTIAALVVVAIAAVWLVARTLAKRRNPGCGTDCGGCDTADLKPKIKR